MRSQSNSSKVITDITYDSTSGKESLVLRSGDKKILLSTTEIRLEAGGQYFTVGKAGIMALTGINAPSASKATVTTSPTVSPVRVPVAK